MKIHGKLELVYLAFVPYVLCYEIVSAVIVPERRQHHSCLQYHLHDSRVLCCGKCRFRAQPPVTSTKIVVRCGDVRQTCPNIHPSLGQRCLTCGSPVPSRRPEWSLSQPLTAGWPCDQCGPMRLWHKEKTPSSEPRPQSGLAHIYLPSWIKATVVRTSPISLLQGSETNWDMDRDAPTEAAPEQPAPHWPPGWPQEPKQAPGCRTPAPVSAHVTLHAHGHGLPGSTAFGF